MASAMVVYNSYRKQVHRTMGKRATREQVDGDIAGDLFLRELRGCQVPARALRGAIWEVYWRKYRGFGTGGGGGEGEMGSPNADLLEGQWPDHEIPLRVLLAKEEGEIATWISRVARQVLPPKSWRVVELWAHGATYEEIAKVAGYNSRQAAWEAVNRALAFLRDWVGKTTRQIEANVRLQNSHRAGGRR